MNTVAPTRRAALVADIKLANNGYLVMEYMTEGEREFARHVAKLGVVAITNGLVHMPATKPEFIKVPFPVKAFAPTLDGPDYEGAILSRQANEGLYD
jgi:hypothetical protein